VHDFLRFAAILLLLTMGWVALIFYSLRALGWGLERRPFVTVAITLVVVLVLIGSATWLHNTAAW
jgi:hypothetical protein